MMELDPINLPVFTLLRPFTVPTVKGNQQEKIELMNYCNKEFFISPEFKSYIVKYSDSLKVEFRCIEVSSSDY